MTPAPTTAAPKGVTVLGHVTPDQATILTPEALQFVATLHRAFNPTRLALLQRRDERQAAINRGELPDFLPETAHIRADDTWRGAPPAPGLVDRRVEITGPVDRKMVINALNSGSATFMADLEDSNSPTWSNNLSGQVNLRDAVHRRIDYTADNGKRYALRSDGTPIATLLVRPRGWHMVERHLLIDGTPCSASLFDFALYFFHNARASLAAGFGPYFYLPKMESHLEARLWNDTFNLAQDLLALPRGTIRATVLIETILAAFEMDEIIYELREHSSGLNCGRWDYIFSFIKKFRLDPRFVLPERAAVTMSVPFMDAYVRLLIRTCHRRGVHAMGGMAAQIPIKGDEKANAAAMAKVRADKEREVRAGHDGTWVAHPALVTVAREVFDAHMPQPNQLYIRRADVHVTSRDLLDPHVPSNTGVSEQGVRTNLSVALLYMEAWLRGSGCVPIHNLMEDAATAEISRSQLWQWAYHRTVTREGQTLTPDYLRRLLAEEATKLGLGTPKAPPKLELARHHLAAQITGDAYADFLTTLCYDDIVELAANQAKL